jgi:hypothetical protein
MKTISREYRAGFRTSINRGDGLIRTKLESQIILLNQSFGPSKEV